MPDLVASFTPTRADLIRVSWRARARALRNHHAAELAATRAEQRSEEAARWAAQVAAEAELQRRAATARWRDSDEVCAARRAALEGDPA